MSTWGKHQWKNLLNINTTFILKTCCEVKLLKTKCHFWHENLLFLMATLFVLLIRQQVILQRVCVCDGFGPNENMKRF
jgi:hypothetical protein